MEAGSQGRAGRPPKHQRRQRRVAEGVGERALEIARVPRLAGSDGRGRPFGIAAGAEDERRLENVCRNLVAAGGAFDRPGRQRCAGIREDAGEAVPAARGQRLVADDRACMRAAITVPSPTYMPT